jgi:predicted nucleic acid-binding Zn ribbon protein
MPTSLGQLMSKVYPDPAGLDVAKVFGWWTRAVPERVVRHARPVHLRRGTLTVHVASAPWAQELVFLKDRLLRAVQRAAPEAGVRDLRFRVGPLPPMPERVAAARPKAEPQVTASLPEDVARALAGVDDDDLRDAIARAAAMSLAPKKPRG